MSPILMPLLSNLLFPEYLSLLLLANLLALHKPLLLLMLQYLK
jgi:hypothetical protein